MADRLHLHYCFAEQIAGTGQLHSPDSNSDGTGTRPANHTRAALHLRWVALLSLLSVELVWCINAFTVPDIEHASGLVAVIVRDGAALLKIGIAFFATFALVLSRRYGELMAGLHDQRGYRWTPWLAGHAVAFGLFVAVSWSVFGPARHVSAVSASWLVGWLATGSASVLLLLFAAAPAGVWWRLLRPEWPGLLAAAFAGCLAWLGGLLAQMIWSPLAKMTFWCTRNLLGLAYADVYEDPARSIVGTTSFAVQIAPVCSGYEGIALIVVFVAAYLWLFRARLRFPSALLLLPVGIVAIWLANVLRVTALIIVGTSFSPEVAVEGFHSQAGWIAFTIVALGIIALAHRYFVTASTQEHISATSERGRDARALLLPLLALFATSMLVDAFSRGFALLYPLGVVATAATLWRYRRHYRFMESGISAAAIAIGVVVFVLWLLLVRPSETGDETIASNLATVPAWLATLWLFFRVVGTVLTVPLAEELAFRGYLLRKLVSRNYEDVPPGPLYMAFVPGFVALVWRNASELDRRVDRRRRLDRLALYRRGQLGDAIVAHMTTNALISGAVLGFGFWHLWG